MKEVVMFVLVVAAMLAVFLIIWGISCCLGYLIAAVKAVIIRCRRKERVRQ